MNRYILLAALRTYKSKLQIRSCAPVLPIRQNCRCTIQRQSVCPPPSCQPEKKKGNLGKILLAVLLAIFGGVLWVCNFSPESKKYVKENYPDIAKYMDSLTFVENANEKPDDKSKKSDDKSKKSDDKSKNK